MHQAGITEDEHAAILHIADQATNPLLESDHRIRQLNFIERIAPTQTAVLHSRF